MPLFRLTMRRAPTRGEAASFIIRASDEAEARSLAQANGDAEARTPFWTNPECAECTLIEGDDE